MTNANNFITLERALIIRMLTGTVIALAVILVFVLGVDQPDPAWHSTWWVRPLVITPLAGAAGGLFFHFMFGLGKQGSWKKIVVTLVGLTGYAIALWLGIVLGLAGTLWN